MHSRRASSKPPLSHAAWQYLPGSLAAALLLLLVSTSLGALLRHAELSDWQGLANDAYLWRVVRFSLWQAGLSALLSVLLAIPVARALARQSQWPGRRWLIRVLELCLVLPSMVVIYALVQVHGRQGWLPMLLQEWGWQPPSYLYGLSGILLAHVFFNLPLCARILLQELQAIPSQHWRLVAQYGWHSRLVWRTLEWPCIRPMLARLFALVFTLCFTSFAIIMVLGGGPRATTLELAIYQALKFDWDIGRAAILAMLQLSLGALLWWWVSHLGTRMNLSPMLTPSHWPRADARGWGRALDWLLILALMLLLLPPLFAVLWSGIPGFIQQLASSRLWLAWWQSAWIASCAGLLALSLALALQGAARYWRSQLRLRLAAALEMSGHVILLFPALVLGVGLFVLLQPLVNMLHYGQLAIILINSLMALPFALHIVRAPLQNLSQPSLRLADSLNLRGWYRWRWLVWPQLRQPLALAWAYAAAISLGDFSVVALFGSPASPTLPLLLYQQLGAYRLQEAAGTALLLVLTAAFIFALGHYWGHRKTHHA